jgi:hypothetical protein
VKSATSLSSPSNPGIKATLALGAVSRPGRQCCAARVVLHRINLRESGPTRRTPTVCCCCSPSPSRLSHFRARDPLALDPPTSGRPAASLDTLWHATAIGFMANNLLPARAGEFALRYVASQQVPVRFSTAHRLRRRRARLRRARRWASWR